MERLSHFFAANGTKENAHKWDIFLSVIGAKTYKVLSDLLSPDKPGEKSSTELLKTLENHYSPNPLEIIERFHFCNRYGWKGESVASYMYVAELRSLAKNCNFKATLESMLQDKIVCRINNEHVQKWLKSRLDYKKAIEIALAMESAELNSEQLASKSSFKEINSTLLDTVHGTPAREMPRKEQKCYRCGNSSHLSLMCKIQNGEMS